MASLISRGADVQRAPEDEREAEDVVDLVGVVAAAGGHDGVGTGGGDQLGQDLRLGIGHGQDQRIGRQQRQPLGLEHARRRQAQEDVGAGQHFRQGAGVGLARVAGHVVEHVVVAAGVNDALDVGQGDVLDRQAHRDQQVDAGQGGRAGARGHQLDVLQGLALDEQGVADGGGADDGGAVLVVVEDRDVHPLAQRALDDEALGGLDVLEIDAAEGGLQGRDHLDELVGILGVDLDVEHVDAGELLEQDGLALHHRLAGQRADIAQAQHGGAVGDHGHQVAARGVVAGLVGIGGDGFARRGDAGRIGQAQVALGGHALGGLDGQFSGPRQTVVVQGGFTEILVHRSFLCERLRGMSARPVFARASRVRASGPSYRGWRCHFQPLRRLRRVIFRGSGNASGRRYRLS
jgi:hypothetical protein